MAMQLCAVRDLRGRAVVTERGVRLGIVKDVVIDVDSGRVVQYIVAERLMGSAPLLIGVEAVVEMRDDALVVKDAHIQDASPVLA